jgi:hypothetical protein
MRRRRANGLTPEERGGSVIRPSTAPLMEQDPQSVDSLLPAVYQELRRLAAAYLRNAGAPRQVGSFVWSKVRQFVEGSASAWCRSSTPGQPLTAPRGEPSRRRTARRPAWRTGFGRPRPTGSPPRAAPRRSPQARAARRRAPRGGLPARARNLFHRLGGEVEAVADGHRGGGTRLEQQRGEEPRVGLERVLELEAHGQLVGVGVVARGAVPHVPAQPGATADVAPPSSRSWSAPLRPCGAAPATSAGR